MKRAFDLVERLLAEKSCPVIAIDGRSAAGKTTLTTQLAERFGLGIVHMDDFFLPFEMRTPERLAEAGGNVHRERFAAEVIPHLGSGKGFSYNVFSCSLGRIDGTAEVPQSGVIVEGAYSMHPFFGDIYDAKIFMDISPQLQRQRIISRSGEEKWLMFEQKWIPMEEKYHTHCKTAERCDLIIEAKE